MFILKKGHQPGVYVPLRALFLVNIILVRFGLLSGHLFGKELLTRLTILHLYYILTIVILAISRFGFEGGIWVLISSIPSHCILVTFCNNLCDE